VLKAAFFGMLMEIIFNFYFMLKKTVQNAHRIEWLKTDFNPIDRAINVLLAASVSKIKNVQKDSQAKSGTNMFSKNKR
jgi:hypothetical protein